MNIDVQNDKCQMTNEILKSKVIWRLVDHVCPRLAGGRRRGGIHHKATEARRFKRAKFGTEMVQIVRPTCGIRIRSHPSATVRLLRRTVFLEERRHGDGLRVLSPHRAQVAVSTLDPSNSKSALRGAVRIGSGLL